jgi:glycerophosphoryl diester phosphodiesterase
MTFSPAKSAALQFLFALTLLTPAFAQTRPPDLDGIPAARSHPFTVRYWPNTRRLAERVLALARGTVPFPAIPDRVWRTREIEIVLAPTEQMFSALTGGRAPAWGAGVTIPARSLIVLPAYNSSKRGGPLEYGRIVRHELAHIALHRMLPGRTFPRWFDEGYATWVAGQLDWEAAWQLRIAFLTGRAPALDSLALEWPRATANAQIAYLLSASIIEYLIAESGQRGLTLLLERTLSNGNFERALGETYGVDLDGLERAWLRYVRRHYGWTVILSQTIWFALFTTLLVGSVVLVRRRRDRHKLAQLRATEEPEAPAYWTEGGIEVIAHRGFSARAPENTVAAMELAIRHHAPALEFDVRTTRDGVPVVIHDETLDRTTNGHGFVFLRSWDELKGLDAGSWFSSIYADERLPRLEDVLRIAYHRVHRVYIELKPRSFNAEQIEKVVEHIVHFEFAQTAVVMSFDWEQLALIRALPVSIRIAFLADEEPAFLQALEHARHDGNAMVDCNWRILLANPALAQRAAELGIELAVYTVNDVLTANELLLQGVRRLTTNEVERLLKWAAGREG